MLLNVEPKYDELHSVSPFSYALNNPAKFVDKDGSFPIDVILDIAFIVSDVVDIAQTMMKGEAVSGAQWGALAGDVVGAVVPGLTGVGKMVKAGDAAVDAAKGVEKVESLLPSKNDNPFNGPIENPVIVVTPSGNAIPVKSGQQLGASKDGSAIQVKDKDGKPTGDRLDKGHNPKVHKDPRSQVPHAHRVDENGNPITNPDGTTWLPVN